MTAHAELRALAEAAKETDRRFGVKWFQRDEDIDVVGTTDAARFISATPPVKVIALLDELDAAHKAYSELVDRVRLADADVILQTNTGSGRGRVA